MERVGENVIVLSLKLGGMVDSLFLVVGYRLCRKSDVGYLVEE